MFFWRVRFFWPHGARGFRAHSSTETWHSGQGILRGQSDRNISRTQNRSEPKLPQFRRDRGFRAAPSPKTWPKWQGISDKLYIVLETWHTEVFSIIPDTNGLELFQNSDKHRSWWNLSSKESHTQESMEPHPVVKTGGVGSTQLEYKFHRDGKKGGKQESHHHDLLFTKFR